MPIAPVDRLVSRKLSGCFRWKMTVRGSGDSTESTAAYVAALAQMTVPLRMESTVHATSRDVSGRPS
jgi:hypothetical protein